MSVRRGGDLTAPEEPPGKAGWWEGLPPDVREAVSRSVLPRRYAAGDVLYAQGEVPPGLFGIRSGTTQTIGVSSQGHPTLLSINRAGEWTGFLSLLDDQPAPFAVVAAEPVDAVLLPAASALRIFGGSADTLALLAGPLISILQFVFDYLTETNNRSPRRVLARRLLDLSRCSYLPAGLSTTMVGPISQSALAAASYLTRQTANRILKAFEKEGLVSIGYGRVDIVDQAGLERVAAGNGAAVPPAPPAADPLRDDEIGPLPPEARKRLAEEGWLPTLPSALRDEVIGRVEGRKVNRGEFLYRQGDPPNGLFAISSGQCRTVARARDGRLLLFSMLHPGFWTGFTPILAAGTQPFSIEVVSPGIAARLSMSDVDALFRTDEMSFRLLLWQPLMLLRTTYQYLVEDSFGPPERIVAKRLYDLAWIPYGTGASSRSFLESLTQEDLVAATGLSRPTVNRAVAALEASGIIGRGYGRVAILRPDALLAWTRPRAR